MVFSSEILELEENYKALVQNFLLKIHTEFAKQIRRY
jgi:hypothetical protein